MQSQKSDMELVRAIREGSVVAFHELYTRYSKIVYRHILARVNSSFDADDIFQEFFVKLWEKRSSLEVTTSVQGYLMVSLRNHILNTIKLDQIREKHHELSWGTKDEADDYTWVKIVAEDLNDKIKQVVESFPPRLKCVYVLSREQNLSVKEIAEKLSVSEQTVKNQLTDILRRLRNEMLQKNFLL